MNSTLGSVVPLAMFNTVGLESRTSVVIVKINHFNSILLKNVDNQDDDGDDGSDVNERKLLWM